jgi:hypothetical protein
LDGHVDEHEVGDHEQHAAMTARLVRLESLLGLGHADAGRVGYHLPAWLRPTRGSTGCR